MVIQVNDLKYDIIDAKTANIHVVIRVIDRNYDTNITLWQLILQNHKNYILFQVIHLNYNIKHWFIW